MNPCGYRFPWSICGVFLSTQGFIGHFFGFKRTLTSKKKMGSATRIPWAPASCHRREPLVPKGYCRTVRGLDPMEIEGFGQ